MLVHVTADHLGLKLRPRDKRKIGNNKLIYWTELVKTIQLCFGGYLWPIVILTFSTVDRQGNIREELFSKIIDQFQQLPACGIIEDNPNFYAWAVCMQVIVKLFKIINF